MYFCHIPDPVIFVPWMRALWFWFNYMLSCFESLYCSLSFTDQMEKGKKNSPSSCGSFHSVTKAAGSMPWQPGLVRCWEKMSVCVFVSVVAVPHTSLRQGPDVLGRSWFSAKWSFCLDADALRIHTGGLWNERRSFKCSWRAGWFPWKKKNEVIHLGKDTLRCWALPAAETKGGEVDWKQSSQKLKNKIMQKDRTLISECDHVT